MIPTDIPALCIDTRDVNLAIVAVQRMRNAGFSNITLFTHDAPTARNICNNIHEHDLNIVSIPILQAIDDYSKFITFGIPQYLQSGHFVVFQWDGFCINPALWWNGFLEYDYIGAPWLPAHRHGLSAGGNGGFSLRSRRLAEHIARSGPLESGIPEDLHLVRVLEHAPTKPAQGADTLTIAPADIARHFSIEHATYAGGEDAQALIVRTGTFGFHGWFNFHLAFDDHALISYIITAMTAEQRGRILGSWGNTALLVNLSRSGRHDGCREVARITQQALGLTLDIHAPGFVQNVINSINQLPASR